VVFGFAAIVGHERIEAGMGAGGEDDYDECCWNDEPE
jgi:hypothetical protein